MRETKKSIKRYSKRFSKKIKNNEAGTRKWAFPANGVSVNMSFPMSDSLELFDIGETSLDVNNFDKIREIFAFNVCAIYSNPICLTRPIHDEDNEITSRTHKLTYIKHVAPLRTPCQEMKTLSLNSESKNLKFLPAAEKRDIFKILQDESNFDPEILFITCHGHNNKILCEDANGRFIVFKKNNDNRLFICEKLAPDYYEKAFISQEEFVDNIIKSGKLKNLKLLFLNACEMHKFGEFVSKKLPNIYVICWNTYAEDVACLDFLKKLVTAINELSSTGKKIIDKNVYIKAAESFIEDYGKKYKNVDRIQDPIIYMEKPDLLKQVRPSGLNCLFHKGEQIESLDLIKQRLASENRYNNYKIDKPPPLIDRPHSAPKSKSSPRSTRKVSIKGKTL